MFDATFPANWPEADGSTIIDLEHAWPAELRDKALAKWDNLGLPRQ